MHIRMWTFNFSTSAEVIGMTSKRASLAMSRVWASADKGEMASAQGESTFEVYFFYRRGWFLWKGPIMTGAWLGFVMEPDA